MEEFFKDFTGPQWTTAVISVLALCLSVYTLYRNRTPRPHWKFERFTDVMVGRRDDDGDVFEHLVGIAAVFKQVGPGAAESVEVRNEEKVWVKANRSKGLVERDNTVSVTIQAGRIKAGRYKVRIRYRCLPNTTRVRTFRKRVLLTGEKIADLLDD